MNPARSWLSRLRFQYSLQTLLAMVLLWSAALGTWSYFRQVPEKREPALIVRDGYVGVIFPRNIPFWNTLTDWEPTARDVERAETRIPEFMRANAPHLAGRLGEYVRQYFGGVVDGHRVVHCSFIRRESGFGDLSSATDFCLRDIGTFKMVMDGGESFFQLLYDPKADSCSGLHINACG